MKINYKIATIVLSAILLVTYAWHWEDIFFHNKSEMKMDNKMSSMGGMHQMPNGEMMMNNGTSMMDMTMTDMVKMMDDKTGKALEKEFITGMIPHHQGAVDMANKLLADPTVSQTLKDFAKQIISAQEGEIKMMRAWLEMY